MSESIIPGNEQLIVVKQLPVIEEQLQAIKTRFLMEAEEALSLACTEDTLQTVKQKRAELSKVFKALEERRIDVKKAILSPYEAFDAIYKECVTDIYKPCDAKLKAKIDEVENGLKAEKAEEIKKYFVEYAKSLAIDFVTFERVGLNITLNASKKSLKEQTKAFLDKISDELALIETQAHRDEILVEYKMSLNAARAITLVTERHRAIDEEKRRSEAAKAEATEKAAMAAKVEQAAEKFAPPKVQTPVATPMPEISEEKIYEVSFRVIGPLAKIKELKQFLVDGGFEYVQF